MSNRVETNTVKATKGDEKKSNTIEVVLKCSYPKRDKDGELLREEAEEGQLGKVLKHKPDDKVKLPYGEAMRLIGKAFAVKV